MYHPRDRGLLDFLAAMVAMVAVYTGTPVGGLVDRGIRSVLGLSPPNRSLISYFDTVSESARGVVPGALMASQPITKPRRQDESLATIRRTDVGAALTRAFAVLASGGLVTMDTERTPWYDVRPMPHHALDRDALGLPPGAPATDELTIGLRDRLADAVDLFAGYRDTLGGEDAGLAAYSVGMPVIRRAVDRAKLTGARDPGELSAFHPFLVRTDADRVEGFVQGVQSLSTAYGMRWPLDDIYPVTSPFGMRIHPIKRIRIKHEGIDLGAPTGTPVRAASGGIVHYAGVDGINGLYLKINHGYGLATAYCHASRLSVSTGDRVKKGQIIGFVGESGRATGPHLHYGVFVGGKPVDPMVFRPPDLNLPFAIETEG